MENQLTIEIPFARHGAEHLCTIRAGLPADSALTAAADLLDAAHDLMLLSSEMNSETAAMASLLLVEMAQAAVMAARG